MKKIVISRTHKVSHDIRQWIFIILNFSVIILTGMLDPRKTAFFDRLLSYGPWYFKNVVIFVIGFNWPSIFHKPTFPLMALREKKSKQMQRDIF